MVKACDMLPKNVLSKLKRDHPNNIVIGHLNINSIREKFECLKDIIGTSIDMLLMSETKLNDTSPQGQFVINGFCAPFREDRNDKGGGLHLFLKDHVPCRRIIIDFSPQIEAIVVEINLKKRIWLLIGCYNHHKDRIQDCLYSIGNKLNELSIKYENIIILGDFNSEMCEDAMQVFCSTYSFKCLVKHPTCLKVPPISAALI